MCAKFHFVDLAGSERANRTGNVGERFKGDLLRIAVISHFLICLCYQFLLWLYWIVPIHCVEFSIMEFWPKKKLKTSSMLLNATEFS